MISDLIRRARQHIFSNQQRRAIARAREKVEREQQNAEIELFLDHCIADGLDPNNPRDFAIIIRAWGLKKGEEIPDDDPLQDWDRTEGRLDF